MSDQEARSTERPPAPESEENGPDIAKAIRAAKSGASAGRHGPPQATAKIGKFELAQALAISSADVDQPPGSSKPPRDDDAPFVHGEVEIVGEEEASSGIAGDSKPPSSAAKSSKKGSNIHTMPTPLAIDVVAPPEPLAVPPKPSRMGLVVVGLVVGCIVIAYAYVTANH